MSYKNLKKWNVFRKIIAVVTLQLFLISNISFAVADFSKGLGAEKAERSALAVDTLAIPRDFGTIKERSNGGNGKFVVYIQDAHCNYEAQNNISKILEYLIKNYNLDFVAVEGADGIVDTSWFKAFPDEDIKREVADYFMKKGEITGAEFLSITSDYPFTIYGAEDRKFYIDNLNSFLQSYPHKEEFLKYYNDIKQALGKLKNYIYSKELKELDAKVIAHKDKELKFADYAGYLNDLAKKCGVDLKAFTNFSVLIEALKVEKDINFDTVNDERAVLIDELSKKLSKDELSKLVNQSLEFKLGKIEGNTFYSYLASLAEENSISIAKNYTNLDKYIVYSHIYAKIDNEKLFDELDNILESAKGKMFQNDDQRALDKLWKDVTVILGFMNIELTNKEYEYYTANKGNFGPSNFIDFVNKQASKYGLTYNISTPDEGLNNVFTKLIDFYEIALKRDDILVQNMFKGMHGKKTDIAVLITGGFHTKGVTKFLKEKDASYVVVSPTITQDTESPYIAVLTGQKTPFEELIIGGAEKSQLGVPYVTDFDILDPLEREAKKGGIPQEVIDLVNHVRDRGVSLRETFADAFIAYCLITFGTEIDHAKVVEHFKTVFSGKLQRKDVKAVFDYIQGNDGAAAFRNFKAQLDAEGSTGAIRLRGGKLSVDERRAVEVITSENDIIRDTTMEELFEPLNTEQLLAAAKELENLRKTTDNLYHKVRACALLNVLYGVYLYNRDDVDAEGRKLFVSNVAELVVKKGNRQFEEAIDQANSILITEPTKTLFTYLADLYGTIMFEEYFRKAAAKSIYSMDENKWMFEVKTLKDYERMLQEGKLKKPEAFLQPDENGRYPVLKITMPVRIELTSNVAADIFYVAADRPKEAKVINVSANLAVIPDDGPTPNPTPPINVYMRVIDKPVIRLRSIDLGAEIDVEKLEDLFNFEKDRLGLLKKAIIGSGMVPVSLEGSSVELKDILTELVGEGKGLELVTNVNAAGKPIPIGSGLAVSTSLLVGCIDAGMKFTGQMNGKGNKITEEDKGLGVVRTVFIDTKAQGGKAGGWQDAGAQWPGIKLCEAQEPKPIDPEYNVTRGKLLPTYRTMTEITLTNQKKFVDSVVLVHCGATQDVGPVLQDVTVQYLLRNRQAWEARLRSEQVGRDQIKNLTTKGDLDLRALGANEDEDWQNRIEIVPLADNDYIYTIVSRLKREFKDDLYGSDSTGCRGGAGHIFIVNPERKQEFIKAFKRVARQVRAEMSDRFPIPVEPTVYDFNLNEKGLEANILMGKDVIVPEIEIRAQGEEEEEEVVVVEVPEEIQKAVDYSRASNEAKLKAYQSGQISLKGNRRYIEELTGVERKKLDSVVSESDRADVTGRGSEAIIKGEVAELTLAAGAGTRFGPTAKPAYPILPIGDRYYSFAHIQALKTLAIAKRYKRYGVSIPHILYTGSETDSALRRLAVAEKNNFGLGEDLIISQGINISQRAYPTLADLEYERNLEGKKSEDEETKRKRELNAFSGWAKEKGQGQPFIPEGINKLKQFNPPGHFYWLWDIILTGSLGEILARKPNLKYLYVHNVDNLIAAINEEALGMHIRSRKAVSAEETPVTAENRGGGCAWVKFSDAAMELLGRKSKEGLVLVEAPACPDPNGLDEFKTVFFNAGAYYVSIKDIFKEIGITEDEVIGINDKSKPEILSHVQAKLLAFEQRLPVYVTLKKVEERFKPEEGNIRLPETYPVAQFERFWGDMSWVVPFNFIVRDSSHMKEIGHRNLEMARGLMGKLLPLLPEELRRGAAIRESGKELTEYEHREQAGRANLNDVAEDLIRAGEAYALIKEGSELEGDVNIGIRTEIEGVEQAKVQPLIDGLTGKVINFVVIKGWREELRKRGSTAADILFHVGHQRRSVYVDEDELKYLLSLADGVDLIIEEAIPHEIDGHVAHPYLSEEEIEERYPTLRIRAALIMKELTAKTSISSVSLDSIKADAGTRVELKDVIGNLMRLLTYIKTLEDLIKYMMSEPQQFTRLINAGVKISQGTFTKEEILTNLFYAIEKSIGPSEAKIVLAALIRHKETQGMVPLKALQVAVEEGLLRETLQGLTPVKEIATVGLLLQRFKSLPTEEEETQRAYAYLNVSEEPAKINAIIGALIEVAPEYVPLIALVTPELQEMAAQKLQSLGVAKPEEIGGRRVIAEEGQVTLGDIIQSRRLPTLFAPFESVRRLLEALIQKKVYPTISIEGMPVVAETKLVEMGMSLEELVGYILIAARAHYRNLVEPITMEEVLRYVEQSRVWQGISERPGIKEEWEYYGKVETYLRELSRQFNTVGEEIAHLKSAEYSEYNKESPIYTLTLETLERFPVATPIDEILNRIAEQRLKDHGFISGVSIAVKIGGTTLASAAVNGEGEVFARTPEVPTPTESEGALFEAVWSQIEHVVERVGIENVVKIGVSTPGPINPVQGVIEWTDNINLIMFAIKPKLEEAFSAKYHKPVKIEVETLHDGDAGALGEASVQGTLPGCTNLLFATISTGVGCGAIEEGEVYWYDREVAGFMVGEIGHVVTRDKTTGKYYFHPVYDVPSRKELAARNQEYLEDYIAGPNLIARMRNEISESGKESQEMLQILNKSSVNELELWDINKAARLGNPLATILIEKAGIEYGRGLAAYVKYWKEERKAKFPTNIVIGGNVAKIGLGLTTPVNKPVLLEAVKNGISQELGPELAKSINVYVSKLIEKVDHDREFYAFIPTIRDVIRSLSMVPVGPANAAAMQERVEQAKQITPKPKEPLERSGESKAEYMGRIATPEGRSVVEQYTLGKMGEELPSERLAPVPHNLRVEPAPEGEGAEVELLNEAGEVVGVLKPGEVVQTHLEHYKLRAKGPAITTLEYKLEEGPEGFIAAICDLVRPFAPKLQDKKIDFVCPKEAFKGANTDPYSLKTAEKFLKEYLGIDARIIPYQDALGGLSSLEKTSFR